MQPEQVDKLLGIGYNMLLQMIVYITIACIIVKFMMKLKWYDTLLMGLTMFALWFIVLCLLCI